MSGSCAGGEHAFTAGSVRVVVGIGDEGAPAVVKLGGELDIAGASEVGAAVTAVLTAGYDVAVDMDELRFCDSSGFAELVRAHNVAHQHGRAFTLRRVQPNVSRTMALVGLDRVLQIEQSAERSRASGFLPPSEVHRPHRAG